MKKIAALVGAILILVTAGYIFVLTTLIQEPEEIMYAEETLTFIGAEESILAIQYDETADFALVQFEGNQYELMRVRSASGARYESNNGLVVFWEQRDETRLEIEGQPVFVKIEPEPELDILLDINDATTEEIEQAPVEIEVVEAIEVVDVPALGLRCEDTDIVDCVNPTEPQTE